MANGTDFIEAPPPDDPLVMYPNPATMKVDIENLDIGQALNQQQVFTLNATRAYFARLVAGPSKVEQDLEAMLPETRKAYQESLKQRTEEPDYPWQKIEGTEEPRYIPDFKEHRGVLIAAGALVVAAIAGPSFARMGAGASMNALAAALKGLHEGNKERYEVEKENYKNEMNKIFQGYEQMKARVRKIQKNEELDQQQKLDQVNLVYKELGLLKKERELEVGNLQKIAMQQDKIYVDLIWKAWKEKNYPTNHPKAPGKEKEDPFRRDKPGAGQATTSVDKSDKSKWTAADWVAAALAADPSLKAPDKKQQLADAARNLSRVYKSKQHIGD